MSKTITVPEASIELREGEHYAGPVLDESGHITHHLVLMAEKPEKRLTWADATAWAEGVGGALPTRQEAALLYANCKAHLDPTWHWTNETHQEHASYAWGCGFGNGYQLNDHKSYEGSARAVRSIHA